MIAEVHKTTLAAGTAAEGVDDTNPLADKAAHAPGSVQLLVLADAGSGEGLVIHLWEDQASYDSFAEGRKELTAETEDLGTQITAGRIYDVTYRS